MQSAYKIDYSNFEYLIQRKSSENLNDESFQLYENLFKNAFDFIPSLWWVLKWYSKVISTSKNFTVTSI